MKSVLASISTWLVLKQTICLEQILNLPYKFCCLDSSDKCFKAFIRKLSELGISFTDITPKSHEQLFWSAEEFANKYIKLSKREIIILSIAKFYNLTLLTNNISLVEAADQENVYVIGILDILEDMLQNDLINKFEYKKALDNLNNKPGINNLKLNTKVHSIVEKLNISNEEDILKTKRA